MVRWLMFPTELGRAPDEIEQIAVLPIDTERGAADLYAFKFKTDPPHWAADDGWMAGVAGAYLKDDQPTIHDLGATFSSFEKLDAMTVREHVDGLIGTIGRVGQSQ